MNRVYGYSVVLNDATYTVHHRLLRPRRWHHGRGYARRVQQKWDKRYGTHQEKVVPDGEVLQMPQAGRLVMNSATWKAFRAAVPDDQPEDRSDG